MITLVYVSAGRKRFDEAELSALLAQCRRNNESLGVTGMLLYADGNFMQAIEGDETVIDALLEKIVGDPRHGQVRMLYRAPIAARHFAKWSMALRRLSDLPEADRQNCTSLVAARLTSADAEAMAATRLESFRRTMA